MRKKTQFNGASRPYPSLGNNQPRLVVHWHLFPITDYKRTTGVRSGLSYGIPPFSIYEEKWYRTLMSNLEMKLSSCLSLFSLYCCVGLSVNSSVTSLRYFFYSFYFRLSKQNRHDTCIQRLNYVCIRYLDEVLTFIIVFFSCLSEGLIKAKHQTSDTKNH